MLEKIKKVRKIINILVILITTILILVGQSNISIGAIDLGTGTINPIYKPEWEKVSSSLQIDANNLKNSTIQIQLRATALKSQTIGENAEIDYSSNVTSTLAPDKILVYIDGELDGDTNNNGKLDDGETPSIQKQVTPLNPATAETVTHTLTLSNFEEAVRRADPEGRSLLFKQWSGNISIKILGRGQDESTYDADVLVDEYGNQNMMEIDTSGTWIDVKFQDGEIVQNTDGTMFADFIKPEFTYKYSVDDINHESKTLKVVFDITDKYFNNTTIMDNVDNITVAMLDDATSGVNTAVTKNLTKKTTESNVTDEATGITYEADGDIIYEGKKIGERYELVIGRLQQNPNDAFDYSGPISVTFPSGIVADNSNNTNNATTITIGVNEEDGNPGKDDATDEGEIVDVVDPIWKAENVGTTTTNGITTSTMDLIVRDKHFDTSTLEKEDIQVIVAGVNVAGKDGEGNPIAPELQTTLSEPIFIKWNSENGTYVENVSETEANGLKYTYTVSNFEESYEAFFEARADETRVYREYSGPSKIYIPRGIATDKSENPSEELTINLGTIDTLKPEVVKVSSQSNINETNVELSTHTIVFDIVDKYLDTSAITTEDTSKIHVLIDGEEATTVTKTITDIEQLGAVINGTPRKVGYRYTLELSNFENPRSSINYTREYTDWSGKLTIKIDANTAYDENNLGNKETIIAGNEENTENVANADFVDYIKPDATYEYSETDVDDVDKEFTMTFDITDKYFYSEDVNANGQLDDGEDTNGNGVLDDGSNLEISDLQILISAENETEDGEDGYHDLKTNPKIGKSFRVENLINTVNGSSKIIGKRYTLTLSNLEQLQRIEGNYYLDYSGAITIIIPQGKVTDTSGNGNDPTSITSGINIPGGEITDIENIDVVHPLWERVSFTTDIHNKTATIYLRGTDKYFWEDDDTTTDDDKYSTLTRDEIKLYINGTEATGNIDLTTGTKLYEERIVINEYGDGDVDTEFTTENVQYGVEYTITITDFAIDANQVKVQLVEGSLVDKSNNKSRTTEFLVYNTLRAETEAQNLNSKFLNEIVPEGRTAIERQDIEKVVFVNSITGSTAAGVQNVWDVSAQRDNSILAWYSETSAPYTVYIGSNDDIYGNVNSSYLFSYIGYGENCDDTQVIQGLNLLHTENVTNMSSMFLSFGRKAMTSLILPESFDTSSVTDMSSMFEDCGFYAMTSLTLPSSFDTSSVTDMSSMFSTCGYTAMTGFELPESFDTSSVTDMSDMFYSCGYKAMTSLELPESFDTSSVTDMSSMFNSCGYTAMTSLELPESFDTSSVTDMSSMFKSCGYTAMTSLALPESFDTSSVENMSLMFAMCGITAMTSLDLGEKFDTRNVTNMDGMFAYCGIMSMTSLDLGPAFTKIADNHESFMQYCGKNPQFMEGETIQDIYEQICIIYLPESIYRDTGTLKLNTDSSETISVFGDEMITLINPKYKPEWTKVSSSLTIQEADNLEDSTMTITVNGKVDPTVYADAIKTITSSVTPGNDTTDQIKVLVDGESAENITKTIVVETAPENQVQYKITLSNFEETVRQSGKNFKEWAGNVALQFAKGSLIDAYGNKNMVEIDVVNWDYFVNEEGEPLIIEPIQIADETPIEANVETGKMFADFIKPEFTYGWTDTIIGSGPDGDKKVKIVFDVTDKYFASSTLGADTTANLITVKVDNEEVNSTVNVNKTLTKTAIFVMNKQTKEVITKEVDYTITDATAEQIVGERYELLVEGLETENGIGYSGPMTLAFESGVITDKSGNINNPKTITIGVDEPEVPYIPEGYTHVEGDLSTGYVIQDNDGNQYVWVEVPKTAKVYSTAGLNITEFSADDYTKIENDLKAYTLAYGSTSDVHSGNDLHTGMTSEQYTELKRTMLKSIYKNGGFYVGRYETGYEADSIANMRYYEADLEAENPIDEIPVIKANVFPYNYVRVSQAQILSTRFASEGYKSSLMFGVQWNLILKYLETKGVTRNELIIDSSHWGNYMDSKYTITNPNASGVKVDPDTGAIIGGAQAPYTHNAGEITFLSTGADDSFSKQGIYDLAGNMREITLSKSPGLLPVVRGGAANFNTNSADSVSTNATINSSYSNTGFRVALYKDEGTGADTETEAEIVDVVNPLWTGPNDVNTIERADTNGDGIDEDTVNITILGSDKYYANDIFAQDLEDGTIEQSTLNKISVYVDNVLDGDTNGDGELGAGETEIITKTITPITDQTQLATLAANAGLPSNVEVVGYILTLSNFGDEQGDISGITKIVIEEGTIVDDSTNQNLETTIFAGNDDWEETNEPLESTDDGYPRYPAFRNDIVDFIDPSINYEYSVVEGEENPYVDYEQKTVTVKFTVKDKYLLQSDLIKTSTDEDGNTILLPKNISILVDGVKVYDGNQETQTTQVTTSMSVADIAGGKEYILVVSNLQQHEDQAPENTTPENGDGFSFSGPMQIVFEEGVIEDTSGNKNATKTITVDTEIGPDIVDVVDPVIYYTQSSRDKDTESITLIIRVDDKYLTPLSTVSQELADLLRNLHDNMIVKVVKPNGYIVESKASSATLTKTDGTTEATTTISREITRNGVGDTYMTFKIVLSDFEEHEGVTSVIIPEDVIFDDSGNGNKQTIINVGNPSDTTAFGQNIVDFTDPTWEYSTSTIDRDWDEGGRRLENGEPEEEPAEGTVTLEVKGTDIYFDDKYFNDPTYQLNLSNVKVYINDVEHTEITKTFATNVDGSIKKQSITQTLENGDILKGVKYTIILGGFEANEGSVRIDIPRNAIRDTSINGNILTPIDVGNPAWIETDVEPQPVDTENPKYAAFRGDIVDFIKPVITYQTAVILRSDKQVQITFDVTDTNYLESNIGTEDIQIFVDDDYEMDVTDELQKSITSESITNGLRYTLTLSDFELADRLPDANDNTILELFKRHSGRIRLVIEQDQVADSSGNMNNEKEIIINEFVDDDVETTDVVETIEVVDFVKPIIYYDSKYINWNERYAEVTVKGTDRFFSDDSVLDPSMLKIYEQNLNGDYVEITNFAGKIEIFDEEIKDEDDNLLGYNYTIRLNGFEDEYKMKIHIDAGELNDDGTIKTGLSDTSGNLNEATDITVVLDNQKPKWEYVSSSTITEEGITDLVDNGKISFIVKGVDKFLDLTRSGLNADDPELKVLRDGVDVTSSLGITVTYDADNSSSTEKSKAFKIELTGITEIGTYSLVFEAGTLFDEFGNTSAAKTITFSKSAINSNTGKYTMVTYHVSPDNETKHNSFVHELMSVNTTGTNYGSQTFRPSSLGELYNNGENPLFREPSGQSFAGWAEADEKGNAIDGANVYGLYDDIPNTKTHLKAIWQEATVVYVSSTGDNSNDGLSTDTPVQDLITAYSKLNPSGTAENNIIVIMNAITFDSYETLNGNATITSLYAGIDYRVTQNAELKTSIELMTVNGDIIFDNIELYTDADTILVSNYSGDITLGRNVTSPEESDTFGSIFGGELLTETLTGNLGTYTIRVEAGRYYTIVPGSGLEYLTETSKNVTHKLIIGNMRDTAVSRNDKLTIHEVGSGVREKASSSSSEYVNMILYSGTIGSDDNGGMIYLRSMEGQTDGKVKFEMYGGVVYADIYAGSATTTMTGQNLNTLNFYGGEVNGDIFGQGLEETIAGGSTITLAGNVKITGNIYGGSHIVEAEVDTLGVGDTTIIMDSSSATVNGNIYGGSKVEYETTKYVEGDTNITINAGTVSNIYGGGNNCDTLGEINITVNNGTINQNIYGGAESGQVRITSNITVLGGRIKGDIYGGNNNLDSQLSSDTRLQDVNIIIGDNDPTQAPKIDGAVYGSGKYDKIDEVEIQLIESENLISVYGGSDANSETTTANIYLNGMTVNQIYGGGKSAGVVGTSNIFLQAGTVTDVYGGGYAASVTTSNIDLEGTQIEVDGETVDVKATATTIYGGTDRDGTVETSNVMLTSGTVTNVFGGGNSAEVGTANVTLNGITIFEIYGGSYNAGITGETNVTLLSGEVTSVFGGGLDVGVTTSNVFHKNDVTLKNIYGGSNTSIGTGGNTGTTNITIKDSNVENVYGGNRNKGISQHTNINIQGTSIITGNLFGGGYKTAIGKDVAPGSTTINIDGGTINTDINGGSKEEKVYGTTNINIGYLSTGNGSSNAGDIVINGTIYGAGSSTNTGYTDISVVGDTHITMYNDVNYPITYTGTIYGSGNGSIYSNNPDNSSIHLIDMGTSTNAHQLVSIERTDNLYIGNSFIELIGRQDQYNYSPKTSYTLNRITNGLTVYKNTTLYTQRGFNMVGGFNSYSEFNANTGNGAKATATINGTEVSRNVDNRLYTLEGINLIFAKQEGNIYADPTADIWGNVNGMTFFGMYAINRSTGEKQYDIYAPNYTSGAVEGFFANGTYVEGREKEGHQIDVDGFYTNVATYGETITVKPQIIETIDYGSYYDWIVGADVVNYNTTLIASTYRNESIAELLLDYKYADGATYTLNRVSLNALNIDVNLIDSLTVPTISDNANRTFGLTMETDKSGWLNSAVSNIYTAGNGSFAGDTAYISDTTANPGKIIFRLNNSVNITEKKDLGNVNLILTGKVPTGADGTPGNTFIVVIAVNIQTKVDELKEQYVPSFRDSIENELSYTTDSKVDLSYLLYKDVATSTYATGDYRVISSTVQFPVGTTLTLKDYGQGDNLNKVYYYHITNSTPDATQVIGGKTRYMYKLSNFIEMGSKNSAFADNNSIYYHSSADESYILEKYDISIDFGDANINTTQLEQETYLELRNSSGNLKYNNGGIEIKFNLYSGKNAVASEQVTHNYTGEDLYYTEVEVEGGLEGETIQVPTYTVVDNLSIPITLNASLLEQNGIMDTKYYDQIAGIAIQIVDEQGTTIKAPQLQNFKLTNEKDATEVYMADPKGVIRMPIIEGMSSLTENYILSMTQSNVPPSRYTAQIIFYTADDGKYYGTNTLADPHEFYVVFESRLLGQIGVDATYDSRIINKTTGKNIQEDNGTNYIDGVDMTISISKPTSTTNIRVELYKRNSTYTKQADETYTYNGTEYTLVDLKDYFEGTWKTPEQDGLISTTGTKEYMVSSKKTYETPVEIENVDFEKELKDSITSGEYKLVFKAYSNNALLQTIKKTFIVTP